MFPDPKPTWMPAKTLLMSWPSTTTFEQFARITWPAPVGIVPPIVFLQYWTGFPFTVFVVSMECVFQSARRGPSMKIPPPVIVFAVNIAEGDRRRDTLRVLPD